MAIALTGARIFTGRFQQHAALQEAFDRAGRAACHGRVVSELRPGRTARQFGLGNQQQRCLFCY